MADVQFRTYATRSHKQKPTQLTIKPHKGESVSKCVGFLFVMKKILIYSIVSIIGSFVVSYLLYLILPPLPPSNICIHSITLEYVDCTTGTVIQG